MGSPLGPLLANTFMTSLEEDLTTTIKSCLCSWKRYVDDIHAYVELIKVEFILDKLNSYYPNISCTFELEKNNEIKFLDVLIKRVNNNKLETGVYQKPTNSDIYINWNAHAFDKQLMSNHVSLCQGMRFSIGFPKTYSILDWVYFESLETINKLCILYL